MIHISCCLTQIERKKYSLSLISQSNHLLTLLPTETDRQTSKPFKYRKRDNQNQIQTQRPSTRFGSHLSLSWLAAYLNQIICCFWPLSSQFLSSIQSCLAPKPNQWKSDQTRLESLGRERRRWRREKCVRICIGNAFMFISEIWKIDLFILSVDNKRIWFSFSS